jgi:rSAM/selenodomain-associated transferase 2
MISLIIPALNESEHLPILLSYLHNNQSGLVTEIIVVDGNSSDGTAEIAAKYGAKVVRLRSAGRARQMNAGAEAASSPILYFLHADSFPPKRFDASIVNTYKNGVQSGCFRLKFDERHWFLTFNAWFTRFNIDAIRFGDQSLFVSKDVFKKIGGYREDHLLLEDQEIVTRIRKHARFCVIPEVVKTSARKYRANGFLRLQLIYYYIYTLYRLGVSQERLVEFYKARIRK